MAAFSSARSGPVTARFLSSRFLERAPGGARCTKILSAWAYADPGASAERTPFCADPRHLRRRPAVRCHLDRGQFEYLEPPAYDSTYAAQPGHFRSFAGWERSGWIQRKPVAGAAHPMDSARRLHANLSEPCQ